MRTITKSIDQKTNKSSWLCPNCIYSGQCAIEAQAVSPIYYCEEHFIELKKEVPLTDRTIKPIPLSLRKIEGLCDSCDLQVGCTLKSEGQIIFNCEHYH